MRSNFAAAFGIGLVVIAIAIGGIFYMQRGDRIELPGKIIKVRTAPLDEESSIAIVDCADGGVEGCRAFVDGGLWANNPVLIGLVDALAMAPLDQPIEIFCLGTCPRPATIDREAHLQSGTSDRSPRQTRLSPSPLAVRMVAPADLGLRSVGGEGWGGEPTRS